MIDGADGSPPRMRGKLDVTVGTPERLRITPAHAGKTASSANTAGSRLDHPRACGENVLIEMIGSNEGGSPPRMRGKRFSDRYGADRIRITPAHAGKTIDVLKQVRVFADHPRACGENLSLQPKIRQMSGSPPRMRGKHIT